MKNIIVIIAALSLVGCMSPQVRLDNAKRLMARKDFQTARDAAPEWCRDALKTINALELQLEKK